MRRVWPRLINTGPLFLVEMFRALPLIDFPRICRRVASLNVNQYGDLSAETPIAESCPKLFKRADTDWELGALKAIKLSRTIQII